MNLDYNAGVPAANDDPSVDQGPMLTNTVSASVWPTIDHHGYGDTIGGYHTIIHQDTSTPIARTINRTLNTAAVGFPAPISGINQLFSALVTTPVNIDTQLFNLTGMGGLSQMTGNYAAVEGYVWCAGILIQWGTVTGTVSGNVIFSGGVNCIPYPTNCYAVITGLRGNSSTAIAASVSIYNLSQTQFNWKFGPPSAANYIGFYWVAIGN